MMMYVFAMVCIFMFIDLEKKADKLIRIIQIDGEHNEKKDKKEMNFKLDEFVGKMVYINLNEDCEININSEFLYDQIKGEIIDFDNKWIAFKFYNKTKKKNICQFIRLIDIDSIDIVSND